MKLYSNPKSSYFEYFMLLCLNVLDVTLKCLEFSCTMFMCLDAEVMSFCKDCIDKMAFLLTLSICPVPTSKQKKKKMPE